MDTLILAIDPGREKIGLALVDSQGHTVFRTISREKDFTSHLVEISQRNPRLHAAVGNSTGREKIIKALRHLHIPYTLVDERNSSQEARTLFFREYPPRGLKKILPLSFLFPNIPFDDFQAVVIGHRFLEAERSRLSRESVSQE
ncbi:MAG TPA: hypothetical protein VLH40_09520 [Atribacteraceae bacterium]|nr:hypothetical protein [Atribacteraceae bacterium]